MRLLYGMHIPLVIAFLLFVVFMVCVNWKGRLRR